MSGNGVNNVIVTVDLAIVFGALTIWALICAVLAIVIYPASTLLQKLSLTLAVMLIGWAIPAIVVLLMPKIVMEMWSTYLSKSRRKHLGL